MRQVPPPARPGGTATGVTSPGNTAEPSRELSVGDVVAVGEVPLAVGAARRTGTPVTRRPLTEVRTREHGTHPLPVASRTPETAIITQLEDCSE